MALAPAGRLRARQSLKADARAWVPEAEGRRKSGAHSEVRAEQAPTSPPGKVLGQGSREARKGGAGLRGSPKRWRSL